VCGLWLFWACQSECRRYQNIHMNNYVYIAKQYDVRVGITRNNPTTYGLVGSQGRSRGCILSYPRRSNSVGMNFIL